MAAAPQEGGQIEADRDVSLPVARKGFTSDLLIPDLALRCLGLKLRR